MYDFYVIWLVSQPTLCCHSAALENNFSSKTKAQRLAVFLKIPYLSRMKIVQGMQISIFIALIHPIQWTIALPVGATGPAKRQKKTSCI